MSTKVSILLLLGMPSGKAPRRESPASPAVDPSVGKFVNKEVPFRFLGHDLRFQLSHGLFSSFDVDDGSRLLLKSIAQRVDLGSVRTVLDVGCGVGVLGACVARHAPQARVALQDRDALAVAIARSNCVSNGLPAVELDCRLAFHGLAGSAFDLVVCNIPAKAGEPVLRAFFRHAAGCLSPAGLAAVVIVAPLAPLARQSIQRLGCALVHAEETPAYSVFHFSAGSAPRESDLEREDLSPYLRATARFAHGGREHVMETAHSLPDFDTLGHDVELGLDLLQESAPLFSGDDGTGAAATEPTSQRTARSVLLWNPGQGHFAVAAAQLLSPGAAVTLASRDSLECAITQRNLARLGDPAVAVHFPSSEAGLAEAAPPSSVDLLIAAPHPVPRVPWQPDLLQSAKRILKPGGALLVTGTSTEVQRFRDQSRGLRFSAAKKRGGYRALLMRKPSG